MMKIQISVIFALGFVASCLGGVNIDLVGAQQNALRGNVDAARQVAEYYIGNPELCGGSFWLDALGCIGTDSDKLYAVKFLYGEDPAACRAARRLLSLIHDRSKYQSQIDELAERIAVYERENEAAYLARVDFRRKQHDQASRPNNMGTSQTLTDPESEPGTAGKGQAADVDFPPPPEPEPAAHVAPVAPSRD